MRTAVAASSPLLRAVLGHPPDALALGAAVRYCDLDGGSHDVAAALLDGRATLDGAAVAFLAAPGRRYVELLLGVMRAGGTAVPLSPHHTAPELAYLVKDARPEQLVATSAFHDRLSSAAGRAVRDDATLVPPLRAVGVSATPQPAAPALMLYTSGTTGRPKGVVLSHDAVLATLAALAAAWRWERTDRLLHVLPLHHTHGLIVALLGALHAGANTTFLPFQAEAVWEQLAHATVFMAVPTMYARLMDAFRAARPEQRARWAEGARRLRLFTSGSAALPASLLEQFRATTGQFILERYGMTEIGMALSNPYDQADGPRVAGAVGRPLPGVTVDLVTDDGRAAAVDEPGELRIRTPQLFTGYHRDPAATAASFDAQNRFRSGDTGLKDSDGVIRLLGRTSVDVLKSAGYKISALEIEAVLREHPAVADVAVIGVPDPTWGECVTACVVLRAGATLELESLKAFSRERLAPYKLPRALRLLDQLPRNAMGKVQKKALLTNGAAAPPGDAP